jgi:glycosyltransferase involved in cell wall biosynthesis
MPDGRPWPRVSIVTPSFNQGRFLEETIRSVLLQGYPALEYAIIDGGSNDGSVDIIRKYAKWLSYWVTERDRGQSHAIAKGFAICSGEIVGWINSDDHYLPDALRTVSTAYLKHGVGIIAGDVVHFREGSVKERLVKQSAITLENMVRYWQNKHSWSQPGLFFPLAAYHQAGALDTKLRYAMDLDVVCRLLMLGLPVIYLEKPLARFRLHPESKSCSQLADMMIEASLVSHRYFKVSGNPEEVEERRYLSGILLHVARMHVKRGELARCLSLLYRAIRDYSPQVFTVIQLTLWKLIMDVMRQSRRALHVSKRR